MKLSQKRKGTQVNANVDPANAPKYAEMAADARRGRHEFASDVLNLIVECATVSGLNWDHFKIQLPGYSEVSRARRTSAAADLLAEGKPYADPLLSGIGEALRRPLPHDQRRDVALEIAAAIKKAGGSVPPALLDLLGAPSRPKKPKAS